MAVASVSDLRPAVAMRSAGQVLAARLLDRDMWACQQVLSSSSGGGGGGGSSK